MGSLIRPTDEWIELQRRKRERDQLQHELSAIDRRLTSERLNYAKLKADLDRIETDKRRLEGLSLPAMFHAVLGTRRERVNLTQQRLLAVRLAFDTCRASIVQLQSRREPIEKQLAAFADVQPRFEAMMHAKAHGLLDRDDPQSRRIVEMAEKFANTQADVDMLVKLTTTGNTVRVQLDTIAEHLRKISRRVAPVDAVADHPLVAPLRPVAHAAHEQLQHFAWQLAEAEERTGLTFGAEELRRFGQTLFGSMIDDFITGRGNRQATQTVTRVHHRVTVILDILHVHQRELTTTAKQMDIRLREAIEQA